MNPIDTSRKRGAIAIAVMVCMLIATALAGSTLRSALSTRWETRRQRQLRQTELLVDAGVLRAQRQLELMPEFDGETWTLSNALNRFGDAVVEIRVLNDDAGDDSSKPESPKTIVVTASIMPDGDVSARTQRSTHFEYGH